MVDIAGVKVRDEFEFIHIIEDAYPYPMLLGLDLAIYVGGIINFKKKRMVFENESTRVIVPLDPAEGEWYMKPVRKKEDVDKIYKLTM